MSAIVVPFENKFLPEVRTIFFESSTKKEFKDEAEKEAFFYKYVGHYLKYYPEYAFVALEDKVLGYLVASPESESNEFNLIQPHLKVFHESFQDFPAHLHINCHHESRGKGIGRLLVAAGEERLRKHNISGLHIMTGVDARNQSFYQRLGFNSEISKTFNGSLILLMGKKL